MEHIRNPRAEVARLAERRAELEVVCLWRGGARRAPFYPDSPDTRRPQRDLRSLELQIYNYESTYLKESPYGNAVRGWQAYKCGCLLHGVLAKRSGPFSCRLY